MAPTFTHAYEDLDYQLTSTLQLSVAQFNMIIYMHDRCVLFVIKISAPPKTTPLLTC